MEPPSVLAGPGLIKLSCYFKAPILLEGQCRPRYCQNKLCPINAQRRTRREKWREKRAGNPRQESSRRHKVEGHACRLAAGAALLRKRSTKSRERMRPKYCPRRSRVSSQILNQGGTSLARLAPDARESSARLPCALELQDRRIEPLPRRLW